LKVGFDSHVMGVCMGTKVAEALMLADAVEVGGQKTEDLLTKLLESYQIGKDVDDSEDIGKDGGDDEPHSSKNE
jgi:hypothetical protein